MSGSDSRSSSTALFCGVPLTKAAAAFDCPFVALSLCNGATEVMPIGFGLAYQLSG